MGHLARKGFNFFCFYQGYSYNAIVALLERNGVRMHARTLQRRLNELGLKRKGAYFDEILIRDKITQEIEGAGSLSLVLFLLLFVVGHQTFQNHLSRFSNIFYYLDAILPLLKRNQSYLNRPQ